MAPGVVAELDDNVSHARVWTMTKDGGVDQIVDTLYKHDIVMILARVPGFFYNAIVITVESAGLVSTARLRSL